MALAVISKYAEAKIDTVRDPCFSYGVEWFAVRLCVTVDILLFLIKYCLLCSMCEIYFPVCNCLHADVVHSVQKLKGNSGVY